MYIVSVIVFALINIIAVLGLSLLTGFTGLFSLGHAGFMSVGAYTAVLLNRYLGIPFLLALLLGGVAAVLVSILIGYPSLRNKLRGDYFAICMLGFGEVVRLVFNNIKPYVNGAVGITAIPKYTTIWVALITCALMVFFMRNFIKSHYGQNCVAIQQQEVAAEMMGINVVKTKLMSLMISAFYCGIAGGLTAFFAGFLSPMTFSETKSTDLIATVVIGGVNSITGPAISAVLLVVLPEFLRFLVSWRMVIYGLLFVLIVTFRPEGLMGYRELSFKWVGRLINKARGKTNVRDK